MYKTYTYTTSEVKNLLTKAHVEGNHNMKTVHMPAAIVFSMGSGCEG
jgi:hypothetical protein